LIQILSSGNNTDAARVLCGFGRWNAGRESTSPAASGLAAPSQAAFNGRELSVSGLPAGDVVTEIGLLLCE
jgi:hypothetical protein